MSKGLFREGGPHHIKRTGSDQYTMKVTLPQGSDGCIASECPNETCSPGYFKVKSGTGVTEGQVVAYCPYCRFESAPSGFATREQLRYAKELVVQEAHDGVDRMIKTALGLGSSGKRSIGGDFLSIEMSYEAGQRSRVRRPFEEDLRRDVVCPHCGLDHSVYGLATWCADCGEDIFLTHIEAELNVVKAMLSDTDRRREILGGRVAAKDIENCLEDVVSIFEAVLRAEARRHLSGTDKTREEIDQFFGKIGNAFQNVLRAKSILEKDFDVSLVRALTEAEIDRLVSTFEKRHPITHNLGVVDKKYIERARTAAKEGREILVSVAEIESAIELSMRIFRAVHADMWSES